MMKVYEIDGTRFSTLEEFYDELQRALSLSPWGRNLDAFNDVLRGGFGTPDDGFTILWKNHTASRQRLGYPETARQLELRLQGCHPANRKSVSDDLEIAKTNRGPTVFDWLVEMFRSHGRGGKEEQDGVRLLLE